MKLQSCKLRKNWLSSLRSMILLKRSRVLRVVSYSFINQNRPGWPGLVRPERLTDWYRLFIVVASKDPQRQTCIGSNGKPMPIVCRTYDYHRRHQEHSTWSCFRSIGTCFSWCELRLLAAYLNGRTSCRYFFS